MSWITRTKPTDVAEIADKDCLYCEGRGMIASENQERFGTGFYVTPCSCVDIGKLLSVSHAEDSHISVRLVERG